MKQPIAILGAGGFALEAFSWIQQASDYEIAAFFSDGPETQIYDRQVFHNFDAIRYCQFIVAVGDPRLRRQMWERAIAFGLQPCLPIIHPTAVCGANSTIGRGSIVCPKAVVTCDVSIELNCLVNIGATIGHEAKLGMHVNVAPGANISGRVIIDEGAYIGTNAAIREGKRVGAYAVIGMGTAVVKDVEAEQTVVGAAMRSLASVQ